MTWSLTSSNHEQQGENPYSNHLRLEGCWTCYTFPRWLAVSSPETGKEQVKTEQLIQHLTGSITVLLYLCQGLCCPQGWSFYPAGEDSGTTCELTAHTCFSAPSLDTPYDHLRSAACVKGVWSWSSGLAPSKELSFIQFYKWVNWGIDFPRSSAGKESACIAGDSGSIPGSGRSLGEGTGYSLQYSWTSWWLSWLRICLKCRRPGFNPWVGKIPGGGNGNPLQYSCLENSMDRGAWRATVHGVAKSRWVTYSRQNFLYCSILLRGQQQRNLETGIAEYS